jgi:hypothetical protein
LSRGSVGDKNFKFYPVPWSPVGNKNESETFIMPHGLYWLGHMALRLFLPFFFNVLSNRGIKRKLSSNNRDQMPTKNVQELISKVCVIAGTDYIFKP